jgi:hypothetical protein
VAKKASAEVAPGVTDAPMDPSLHLMDGHAASMGDAAVGDTVPFEGHGVVESMSQHDGEGGPSKSMTIRVKHLKHKKKASDSGKVGGKDTEMQEGGKAAMDNALSNEANAEDSQP